MPQLTIRSRLIHAQGSSGPTGPAPGGWSSAIPLISMPRGVQGSMLAMASTTMAAFGLAFMSRYFLVRPKLRRPTSTSGAGAVQPVWSIVVQTPSGTV